MYIRLTSFLDKFPDIKVGVYTDYLFFITTLSNRKLILYTKYFIVFIESEHDSGNYLYVNLDFVADIYSPYHKPKNTLKRINFNINHTKAITKNLAYNILERIPYLFSYEEICNNNTDYYNPFKKGHIHGIVCCNKNEDYKKSQCNNGKSVDNEMCGSNSGDTCNLIAISKYNINSRVDSG